MVIDLTRFPEFAHANLARCAALSERIAQLAQSHPLLLFALATGYGPIRKRKEAVRLAVLGRPLRDVSAAAGIPYGLRHVLPEDLSRPLLESALSERAGDVLAGRIARARIVEANRAGLAAAFYGSRICDEVFGVWLADPRTACYIRSLDLALLRPLALYAWGSRFETTMPSVVWSSIWSPQMSFGKALAQAQHWVEELKFYVYFDAKPIADAWAEPAEIDGFSFSPLLRFEALISEVRDMHNCLYTYADRLRYDRCRLFSVRRGGVKLGTVEIHTAAGEGLRIAQFKGPFNAQMPIEARHAAHVWIEQQRPFDQRRRSLPNPDPLPERLAALFDAHVKARDLSPDFWAGADLHGLARSLGLIERPSRRQRRATRLHPIAALAGHETPRSA